MHPLLSLRPRFPSLTHSLYFISHSLGAMPASARDSLMQYADTWTTRSIRAWEDGWWRMPITVGDLIGRIIGAAPGSVAMQPNVSVAQWIILSCLDWTGTRNKLLTDAQNFPTNLYIFHELERLGARLVKVPSPADLEAAIDDETQLVCLSHVLFRDSRVQNLEPITRKAHSMGAMVAADIYQSAGCVPVNVGSLQIDFATGGSVKWLCGGPGAGYLYVRPDHLEHLRPRLTGWAAHQNPFAFDPGPIEYAGDMARFLHGTPSIPALYAAQAGYEIILEAGVERIREKSLRQTGRLIELADEAGFAVRSPRFANERGGTVVLDVPNGYEVTKELLRRDVLLDFRPGAGIRLAPHFYTTDEELEQVIQQIREVTKAL